MSLEGENYIKAVQSCEHKDAPQNPDIVRATVGKSGSLLIPVEVKDSSGKVISLQTKRLYLGNFNAQWGGMMGLFQKQIAHVSNKTLGSDIIRNKKVVEDVVAAYKPMPKVEKLTWKEHLWKISLQCAGGVKYLHNTRYYDDRAGKWKEEVIHRDLKPENFLLTKKWDLKLTDFGEARAVDLDHTMTTVGTPLYMAPEILKSERYGKPVDAYGFGMCLVAMIQAEKNLLTFMIQAVRKEMKKKTTMGIGIHTMNNRLQNEGWRPKLPASFRLSYPRLTALIKHCWQPKQKDRPSFEEIVRILRDEVGDEVRKNPEPNVVYYSIEADEIYFENDDGGDTSLAEKEDKQEDSDGEVGGVKIKMALLEEKKKVTELIAQLKEKDGEMQKRDREHQNKNRMLEELLAKHGVNAEEEFEKSRKEKEAQAAKRRANDRNTKFDMGMLYR